LIATGFVAARRLVTPKISAEEPFAGHQDRPKPARLHAETSSEGSVQSEASGGRQEPHVGRDSSDIVAGNKFHKPPRHPGGPGAAIIIDDVGYSRRALEHFLAIDAPLTFSFLPDGGYTPTIARELSRSGRCVMIHLPMEPEGDRKDLEPSTIRVGMSVEEIKRRVNTALAAVPGARGVNNHMGSRACTDADVVRAVMEVVRERGLFFVDSLTSPRSRILEVANALGVPAAERDVFLDADTPSSADTVAGRMEELATVASRNGTAIGIGHVRQATAEGIRIGLAAFERRGVNVVPASDLF